MTVRLVSVLAMTVARRFAIMILSASALLFGSTSLGYAAPTAGASGAVASSIARTATLHVAPVGHRGHLRSGYRVVDRVGGASCIYGSEPVGHAYRCFGGDSGVYDPCWVQNTRKPNVLCLGTPWLHRVVQLHVTRGFNDSAGTIGSRFGPWAMRTVSDHRCYFSQGATGTVNGFRLNYGCGGKITLVGDVDKSQPVWRIRKAIYVGNYHYAMDGWVNLSKTWYGKATLSA
jgi:hypothetical protein